MKICPILFLIIMPALCLSQNNTLAEYRIETFMSAARNDITPFWMVSNRYGLVPLSSNNGYIRAGSFGNYSIGEDLRVKGGIDVVLSSDRYRDVFVQQLFVEASYKILQLSVGSKENYTSLWDRDLSSGDMVISANARPVPEIDISVPQFTGIPFTKGWLHFRGNFAVGHSFENEYLKYVSKPDQYYTKDLLWHHKSLYIRMLNEKIPFTATIGLRHYAQWGGRSTDPSLGAQPASFEDFIRIILAKSGGETATQSDQINVLGNHYGSYDFKFGYLNPLFDVHIYKQHYFDDASGMEFYNFADGLYGIQVDIPNFHSVNSVVFEYFNTRNQSGPIHYILYDHSQYPGYGGGSDDYYNNGNYCRVSYFNRSMGSPLITSPEYNADGAFHFTNNRVKAFHLGMKGIVSEQVAYRVLATVSENLGTMGAPFLEKENNFSFATRISYCHRKLPDWLFAAEIAADFGKLYGNNAGISLSITKTGVLLKK